MGHDIRTPCVRIMAGGAIVVELGGAVIRIFDLKVVPRVARIAGRGEAGLHCSVALRTLQIVVSAGEGEGQWVIERCRLPSRLHLGMTAFALSREMNGRMLRLSGRLIVLEVASLTGHRQVHILISGVTHLAVEAGMNPNEGESGALMPARSDGLHNPGLWSVTLLAAVGELAVFDIEMAIHAAGTGLSKIR
jgi:hypothetical protein